MAGMSSTQFDIVKFDGYENFELWQRRVKDLLLQEGMVKALSKKQLESMKVMDWKELEARIALTIRLCLADGVMYHVMDEESSITIWLKLEC